MHVGLIDVDGHNFPNLALMKLSAYHKARGDSVEWVAPLFGQYDIAYMSKVFDFTEDFTTVFRADEVIKGGTGYDLTTTLPSEVESIYPDYSLYGITDTAYGYLTRGCPRGCEFCIVGEKEGLKSQKVADLKQFWDGQKEIKLLDPNLLACKDRNDLLDQLIKSKAWVDFTQGLDVRLLDDKVVNQLKRIKVKMIHFAWDKTDQSETIVRNLKMFKGSTGLDHRKLQVYVLVNFDTTMEEDLYRIYTLRELGYTPYVMIFDKQNAPKEIRSLQRWVNNKIIFRSCNRFEDYNSNQA